MDRSGIELCGGGTGKPRTDTDGAVRRFGFDDDILLSIFWPPTPEYVNEEQFSYMEQAGINWVLGAGDGTGEKENQLKMLELCSRHGIGMCVGDDRFGGNLLKLSDAEIKDLVDEYRNVPGAYGYYMLDEPMNPNDFIGAYKALKAADPYGYMHLNFLPVFVYPSDKVYISQMNDWLKLCAGAGYPQEYLMYDEYPYPLEPDTVGMDGLLKNLQCARIAGLRNNVKTAMYVQSVSQTVAFRSPNRSETLYEFNLGLSFGIKQFSYFTWFTPHDRSEPFDDGIISRYGVPNPKFKDFICELGAMMHRVGKTLIHLDAHEVYEAENGYGVMPLLPEDSYVSVRGDFTVSFMKDRRDGKNFCMIVNNRINKPQTLEAQFKDGLCGLSYLSYDDGALHPLNDGGGKVTLELEAGGALIVALPYGFDRQRKTTPSRNLAVGAEIYCTTSAGHDGFYMDNLNDGIRYTAEHSRGWRSASSDGLDTITVDLQTVRGFDRVDLYPVAEKDEFGSHMFTGFVLETSDDGVTYRRIASASGLEVKDGTPVSMKFARVSARYLRIRITECKDNVSELGEIEIYDGDGVPDAEIYVSRRPVQRGEPEAVPYEAGADLAFGKKVVVSSYPEGAAYAAWGWSPDFLTDGKHERGWTSYLHAHTTEDATEYATVDLGDTFGVDTVRLFPRGCWPVDFDVSVSTDGDEFRTVYTERGSEEPEKYRQIDLHGAVGRYVRVRGTKLRKSPDDGYLMRLAGIEVYGTPHVNAEEAKGYIGEYLNHGGKICSPEAEAVFAALQDPKTTQTALDRLLSSMLDKVGMKLPVTGEIETHRAKYNLEY